MARRRAIDADEILAAALALAAEHGWARVRLYDVAARLGVPLAQLRGHVADLDAVGNLLFARADRAMLAAASAPGFERRSAKERLALTLRAWLAALAPHRAAVRAMLAYKLKPAHLHHHAALVVDLSRTVQWWREAARLDATGRQQEVEEIGLSALLAATVLHWLFDRSPGQDRAHRRLDRRLAVADGWMARLFGTPRRKPT